MVPCALDISVATKILDHSGLADGLNQVPSLQIDKKIEALVLTPSTVWHNSVRKKQHYLVYIQCRTNIHTYCENGNGQMWIHM